MIKLEAVEIKSLRNMYRSWELHKKLRNKFSNRIEVFQPGTENFVTLVERENFLDEIFNMIFK